MQCGYWSCGGRLISDSKDVICIKDVRRKNTLGITNVVITVIMRETNFTPQNRLHIRYSIAVLKKYKERGIQFPCTLGHG
jgi:hypothetical protein